MTRTLLVGIDGADPDLMDRFDLPHIESIGEYREIDTYGNSGPSWATVLTGLAPKDHGIMRLKPQSDSHAWQGVPIWEKIDGYTGVANVPMTYPPDPIRGWIVAGMMSPRGAIYTYPRRLSTTLDEMGYLIDIWVEDHQNHPDGIYGAMPFELQSGDRDRLLSRGETVVSRRGDAFSWLLEHEPVDFAFLTFTILDRVQHVAFDDMDVVEHFYGLVDEQVGVVLDAVGPDTQVIACSDHGFERIETPEIDLTGDHRRAGWATANFDVDRRLSCLEDVHRIAVDSANRTPSRRDRLSDLGYLDEG